MTVKSDLNVESTGTGNSGSSGMVRVATVILVAGQINAIMTTT